MALNYDWYHNEKLVCILDYYYFMYSYFGAKQPIRIKPFYASGYYDVLCTRIDWVDWVNFEGKRKNFIHLLCRKMKNAAAANCREIKAGVTSSFSTYRRALCFHLTVREARGKRHEPVSRGLAGRSQWSRPARESNVLKTKLEKRSQHDQLLHIWVLSTEGLFLMTVLRVGSFSVSFLSFSGSPPHTHTPSATSQQLCQDRAASYLRPQHALPNRKTTIQSKDPKIPKKTKHKTKIKKNK